MTATPGPDEPLYTVRDPRSTPTPVELVALAPRLGSLDSARVAVVQTMPPGSGLEPVVEGVLRCLRARAHVAAADHVHRRNFMMTDLAEIDELAEHYDAAVIVSGPAATMVHLAFVFATELERRGIPTAVTTFASLDRTVDHVLTTVGAALRTGHGSEPDAAVDALLSPLSSAERTTGRRVAEPAERHLCRGTLREVDDRFYSLGLTDGLPIVPPTDAAVEEMLTGTTRHRDDVVTETYRPEGRRATVEQVAITAVLAGARPEHFPVILAAASVYGDLQFESMTRSVNSFAFSHVVSGPLAGRAGLTGGIGALGPGNRANATIGRALSLLLRTVGGARTGVNVTPTQGNAAAYTSAFCEHASDTPWEPFHQGLGFAPTESTVSVLLGGWAHNGNFYYGDLDDVVRALMSFEIPQTGAFVLISSKRAHALAAEGWTKRAIEEYLERNATIRLGDFRASGFWPMSSAQIAGNGPSSAPAWPRSYLDLGDDEIVPGYPPGTIKVVVVGSDVSSLIQVWKWQLHRTVCIDAWI
jgi:hypothetical protein